MTNQATLRVRPDDVVVLSYRNILSVAQRAAIVKNVTDYMPGQKVLVLDGGVTTSVLGDREILQRIEHRLDALQASIDQGRS